AIQRVAGDTAAGADTFADVQAMTGETSAAADQVLGASGELSRLAELLSGRMRDFVARTLAA
ncbi:hypothetical protein J8J20_25420, partial [Mycobacterium tuberculosis]|nr:hypothetical protein [Mycobacterium tuberculosis]